MWDVTITAHLLSPRNSQKVDNSQFIVYIHVITGSQNLFKLNLATCIVTAYPLPHSSLQLLNNKNTAEIMYKL